MQRPNYVKDKIDGNTINMKGKSNGNTIDMKIERQVKSTTQNMRIKTAENIKSSPPPPLKVSSIINETDLPTETITTCTSTQTHSKRYRNTQIETPTHACRHTHRATAASH